MNLCAKWLQISEIPPLPPLEKGGWGDFERIPDWFRLGRVTERYFRRQDNLHCLLRTDDSTPAAAPAFLSHDRFAVLHCHRPDETALRTDTATITGFTYADFQALQPLQAPGHLWGEKPVKFKVAAAIAAVADG
jgi:hypothetical protein